MKNALRPIPGASANGYLAYNAMISVATPAERAVAVKTPPKSMPVSESMPGFTARI